MSDHAVQSDHDSDGMGRRFTQSHQSVWMAHWKLSSYKPETHGHDPSSIHYQCRGNDGDIKQHRPESLPGISESSKGFREVSESRTVNIMNDSLKPSSINFGKERLESQSFPMFNLSENRERRMSQKNVTSCAGVVSEMGTSSREFHPEGISANLEQQQLNSHESLLKKSLAISTSNQHDVGSSSKIVPFIYNKGKTPIHSFVCRQEEIHQSSSVVASKDHLTNAKFQSYSTTPLINKDKLYNPIDFRRYGTSSSLRQNNLSLLLHNPSASNNQVPVCVGKLSEKMQNGSGTGLFPDWNCPLDASKSETLFRNFYSIPRIPLSLQDAETMRICTTVDSAKELSPSPEYSQTTHSFLITKKTDVNLSEGGERFKDSTFSTNFDGKMVHKFLNLSPGFGFHAQQSLKLEPLQSSTDSEGKENFGDAKTDAVCLKNESSADTDTMDMDVFEKGHLSGVVSSPKNKIVKSGLISSTLQAEIASSREETGGGLTKTELPDINEELPALPAVDSSVEDRETSSSRTQSLDVEHLLSHAELPTNSKSGAFPDGVEVSDPSSRWVKRLKPSASGSSPYGTKSSKMEEACSHEKVNRFFSKIMRDGVTSSESTMSKHPGKERTAVDQTTVLLRNGESSSSESERKSRDISLANPWIRRLCHQRAASPMKKNSEAVVVCEPQKLNATLDEFQKKQFPSVAAMAMMGKALNSIRPCGFTKKGPYVVWQT
ncbi:hypothetical protein EZV62_011571 [Acer yangbiense]|uniref:Uncharacterized protein n=1 Tax=Acer yangbiense TaxID=1000413 RepID=A0A5C7I5Q0_9ROSI|nr:hypothetical protein EZV62_011571 [Acer yangbiense]